MFLNILTRVFNIFVFSLSSLSLILVKRLFRDSIFKSGEVRLCRDVLKKFVACRPFIYLKKWKQLLRVRLLYNIKVIEDTVRRNEKFSNLFLVENFVFVILVRVNSPQWTVPSEIVDK